jgi:hypothetical protein
LKGHCSATKKLRTLSLILWFVYIHDELMIETSLRASNVSFYICLHNLMGCLVSWNWKVTELSDPTLNAINFFKVHSQNANVGTRNA